MWRAKGPAGHVPQGQVLAFHLSARDTMDRFKVTVIPVCGFFFFSQTFCPNSESQKDNFSVSTATQMDQFLPLCDRMKPFKVPIVFMQLTLILKYLLWLTLSAREDW